MEDHGVPIPSEPIEHDKLRTPTKVLNGSIEEEEEGEPRVGMLLKTSNDALMYYENYGISKEFSVCTRSSKRNWRRCDLFTSYTFACSHYGSHSKKIDENVPHEKQRPNTSTMRGDCQPHMNIVLDKNTFEWRITGFIKDHSHEFASPSKKIYLKLKRKMPQVAKNMVEMFHKENLPVHKVKDIIGDDIFGFNNSSCWNHLRNVRQKLDVGDAQWVSQYFQKRTLENPQFFYEIQCDGEGRAMNFFWVDGRSRMAYKQFGDVVSFDTTYKTNKYNMPFSPFTGVNHHFHTIQFGCALLQYETEHSFIWLFDTWKEAMGGVEPVSMITDSDPAMRAVIPKVFPNTRCRICYWHVKKNFGNNLGHLYKKKSTFKHEVKKCLKYTFRIEDFEKKWDDLITKYDLRENNWLNRLYDDRSAWVPVYNRTTFFVGMNSTGRSEGINAFFKEYVKSSTNLMEFVEKYEKALKKIENNERQEDYKSEKTYRLINKESYLLQHARSMYMRKLFDKFKSNFDLVERYKSDASCDDPNIHIVKYKFGVEEHWIVKFDPQTMEGSCECNFLEFVGIPCAHLLKVFTKLYMIKIPEYFIKNNG